MGKEIQEMMRDVKKEKLYRSFLIERSLVDREKRTVTLSFSSEEPVERWFGYEVLDHNSECVNLQRLKRGGALLIDHDMTNQVGVIEEALIDTADRKGRAKVRFGRSAKAEEIFQDVIDEIRTNVSVGYQIDEMVLEREGKDTPSTYRVSKWTPFEISLVSVPADITVGVGRKNGMEAEIDPAPAPEQKTIEKQPEVRIMEKCTICGGDIVDGKCTGAKHTEMMEARAKATQASAKEMEEARLKAIRNLCKANNLGENFYEMWKERGSTLNQVADDIIAILEERGKTNPQPLTKIGMSATEAKRFSLIRAIHAIHTGDWKDAGFEAEASRTVAQKLGRSPEKTKILVPFEVLERPIDRSKRDLSVASGGGAYLVQTDNMGFIEYLRNRSVVRRMGARTLSGLQGNVAIPKMSAPGTAYWLANETSTITESAPTIVQVPLSPKFVGAYTEISHQLMVQSSPAAEGIVSDDLAQVVAIAGDYACLAGAGSSGEPDGIIDYDGVGSVTGTDLQYADILEFQTDVASSNVTPVRGGYVTTPSVAALMMARQRFSSTDSPLWVGNIWDGQMAGFPAMSTMQCPTADMIFGDWQEMVVGEWGVLEIAVNPYAGFTAGIIGIRALYSMDVAHRRPFAFSIAKSIT